ncbi:MAG TPA: hypothetical protein VGE51_05730 [Fontimonas sp.]
MTDKHPDLRSIAWAYSSAKADHPQKGAATEILTGEREVARRMVERSAGMADVPPFSILQTLS